MRFKFVPLKLLTEQPTDADNDGKIMIARTGYDLRQVNQKLNFRHYLLKLRMMRSPATSYNCENRPCISYNHQARNHFREYILFESFQNMLQKLRQIFIYYALFISTVTEIRTFKFKHQW